MNEKTDPRLGWIKTVNDPKCTCVTGHCFFHHYPFGGSLLDNTVSNLVESSHDQ